MTSADQPDLRFSPPLSAAIRARPRTLSASSLLAAEDIGQKFGSIGAYSIDAKLT